MIIFNLLLVRYHQQNNDYNGNSDIPESWFEYILYVFLLLTFGWMIPIMNLFLIYELTKSWNKKRKMNKIIGSSDVDLN